MKGAQTLRRKAVEKCKSVWNSVKEGGKAIVNGVKNVGSSIKSFIFG